jgi:hypothetical protein
MEASCIKAFSILRNENSMFMQINIFRELEIVASAKDKQN